MVTVVPLALVGVGHLHGFGLVIHGFHWVLCTLFSYFQAQTKGKKFVSQFMWAWPPYLNTGIVPQLRLEACSKQYLTDTNIFLLSFRKGMVSDKICEEADLAVHSHGDICIFNFCWAEYVLRMD